MEIRLFSEKLPYPTAVEMLYSLRTVLPCMIMRGSSLPSEAEMKTERLPLCQSLPEKKENLFFCPGPISHFPSPDKEPQNMPC